MRANDVAVPAKGRPRGFLSPRLMVGTSVLAVVVAACSSAVGAPGYSYAPPSSPPASMATGLGPSASAPATSPASGPPASAAPDPSVAPVGATVKIAARDIQFDTDHLAAPAGQAWVLELANNDPGVPHNVEILDASGSSVFRGQVVTGPAIVSYQIPALAAGSYTFLCDVHPTMTGTLTVA